MTTLTLSRKQALSIRNSDARYNVWVGAVRSGKTFASLLRFEQFCLHGPPGDFAIIGKSRDAIKRNVLGPLTDLLGGRFQYWLGKSEAKLYNRTIHLIGANDERAETKIRGCTLAGIYMDEITILPRSIFDMSKSRLSITGAKLFGATNPDSPFHWLKTEMIDRSDELDVKVFDFNLDDNPSLDESFKINLNKEYTGLWHDRFIKGLWVLAEGTIFDFFDKELHVIDFPPGAADYYVCGVDYGTANPCCFALIGYSDKTFPNRWLEREYYYDSRKLLRQKTDTEYASDLTKFLSGYNVRTIYLDPSALSFKTELHRQGFSGIVEAENDVLDGIRYHSICLSNGTYKVCRPCAKSIEEYSTYRWDAKAAQSGVEKPIKENDHAMDAIRYALYSHWYKKEGPRMTVEDIERFRKEAHGDAGAPQSHGKFFDDKMW